MHMALLTASELTHPENGSESKLEALLHRALCLHTSTVHAWPIAACRPVVARLRYQMARIVAGSPFWQGVPQSQHHIALPGANH